MEHFRTLVLNADFRPLCYYPLSVCSWQEAIKDIFLGRVHVVSEYDQAVRSPSKEMRIPSVISLKRYVSNAREIPALTRSNVFLRDWFECQYCGDMFDHKKLTLDHVVPRSKGGRTTWLNIVSCCQCCNSRKGNKMPGKQFPEPLTKPRIPTSAELQRISREMSAGGLHESWLDFLK